MTESHPDGAQGAQTVRRALTLLRLTATGQEAGLRLTDLVRMSGLTRPTVHRLLTALCEEQAIEQDPVTRRYRIGVEMLLLGLARGSGLPMRAVAEPYLRALAQAVGDTIFLSVQHGTDSVCIGRHLGSHPIQVLSIDVGARRPLGASVSGLVLLAGLASDTAQEIVRSNATRLELQGITVPSLLKKVNATRESGSAYADAGVMPGTRAVAVPVRDPQGQVLAAISMAALDNRLDRRRLPAVLEAMQGHSLMITRRLAEIERARRKPA